MTVRQVLAWLPITIPVALLLWWLASSTRKHK